MQLKYLTPQLVLPLVLLHSFYLTAQKSQFLFALEYAIKLLF